MNYIDIIDNYGIDDNYKEILDGFINHCIKELKLKNILFNVIIINNEDIHKLNNEYRNIDKPTDVITFALEDYEDIKLPNIRVLGDIYISFDKVISQAKEYNHSNIRELCFLTVHGILHLLGHDHMTKEEEKIMFDLQKELLESYGIKR